MIIPSKGNSLSRFDAALFDLDGLLADTEDLHVAAYREVARHLGITLDGEYINAFIGVSTRDNVKRIMKDFGIPANRFDEILRLRYDRYHDIVKRSRLQPMDGALECVKRAGDSGMKRALVTSSMKDHAISVLESISARAGFNGGGLVDSFDAMVFGSEIERLKPEPDIYLEALRRLGTSGEGCVVFEDSEAGVIAAKRARLFTVAVPNVHTRHQNFDVADLRFSSLRDVLTAGLLN
jgi:beta-phosphoglucomutase-like phosphatase (HAD superfamily)